MRDTCKIDGCEGIRTGMGYCATHYKRYQSHGDPQAHIPIKKVIKDPVERFLSLIDKNGLNGCWEWLGTKNGAGYGYMCSSGKRVGVHRYSYEHFHGVAPMEMMVCHHCDNTSCVNPSHLFLGTNGDNVKDSWNKGRRKKIPIEFMRRGSSCHQAILNESDVLIIKELIRSGKGNTEIGRQYKVSHSTISAIRCNITWKHIK